ncbi:MAG TPA: hypothetical protein GXX40_08720 [Firmicutes bacterium]|nr:hypothetical protein [Bacillota bacterium]
MVISRKGQVVVLAALITCTSICSPFSSTGRAKAVNDTTPVLLVHGLASSISTWKNGNQAGMWAALVSSGYQPETTLFTLDYSHDPDPDYAQLFRTTLMSKIEEIKAKTGVTMVDVIAYGYGGLLARFYVQSPGYRGDIRNLVMIATPNHGSMAVQKAKTSLLLLSHAALLLSPKPVPSSFLDLPPFVGEIEYIAERAPAYREKYAQYVMAERMLWVPSPKSIRPRSFEVWFRESFPEEYAATIGNNLPPLGRPANAADGGYSEPPALGQDISLSYFEYVSMIAGKNEYLSAQAKQKVLNDMLTQTFSATSVKDAALKAGKALLIYFAGRLLEPGKAVLERKLLETALAKSRLKPDGIALMRLLEETLPAQPLKELSVNDFLQLWNNAQSTRRTNSIASPRFIMIAGETFNPWKLALADVAPNDLVVEVDSAILEPALDDAIYVVSSGLSSTHISLQNNERVIKLVTSCLREPFPIIETFRPTFRQGFWKRYSWDRKSTVSVSNYAPVYVEVDLSHIEADAVISVEPSDRETLLWAYGKDKEGHCSPIPLRKVESSYRCDLDCSKSPTVILGFRGNAPIQSEKRHTCEFRVSVSCKGVSGEPPKVNVTNRSKSTTSIKTNAADNAPLKTRSSQTPPVTQSAGRWVWDFGDGSEKVETPGLKDVPVSQVHRFPKPGKYRVTASYIEGNQVLQEQGWQLTLAGEDALEVQLNTESVRASPIQVRLVGPEKWVTGRPAQFTVEVKADLPEGASSETVSVDPGREFQVQWAKPGTFEVKATAVVRVTYPTREGSVSATYTALGTKKIEVFSLGITQ